MADPEIIPLEVPEELPVDELIEELLPIPDEETQQELVTLILSDHDAAILDRADWEKNLSVWEDQYLGNLPEKTDPWVGCANFNVPLTMLGVETLKPRLVESVLGSDPIVYAIPTEGAVEKRADTTQLFLNWQVRTELHIEPQVEESAHLFLTPGMVVGKVLWRKDIRHVKAIRRFPAGTSLDAIFRDLFGLDLPKEWKDAGKKTWEGHFLDPDGAKRKVRARFQFSEDEIHVLLDKEQVIFDAPRVDLLNAEDFVVPFHGGGDVQRLPWCHQKLSYSEDELRQKVAQKRFYKDAVELLIGGEPGPENSPQSDTSIQDTRDRSEGVTPDPATSVKANEYPVIESYRQYDIDEDGMTEEIIVWVSPNLPEKILGWDYLDNVFAHGKRPYIVGRYLSLPGRFYGLSFPEVISDVQDEINTIHNQRVDSGTIQNTPGGFFRASMTMAPGTQYVKPGQWVPVDNPQTDVREYKWNGTPTWGQNEEALLYQYFERLTGLTDLALGRQPNRVGATRTASGTAALLSEAGLRFKNSMESFQRFWLEIFDHILALDQQYLPRGKEFKVTGRLPEVIHIESREDIAGKYKLRLAVTSETLNRQVMREDATVKLNAALQSPFPIQLGIIGVKGLRKLYKDFFRSYGEADPDMIVEPEREQVVHTPEQELAIWSAGDDVQPSMLENIPVHLDAHMQQLQSPELRAYPEVLAKIRAHLSQTMQNAQMQSMVNQMQQGGGKGAQGGGQAPVAGDQTMNAMTGRMAPQNPSGFGGGGPQE